MIIGGFRATAPVVPSTWHTDRGAELYTGNKNRAADTAPRIVATLFSDAEKHSSSGV